MTHRILLGDVRAGLAELPDNSVQCCVTSPPYFGLRDYGVDGQLGSEATPEAHVAVMVDVFREVRRVLRPDGVLWLNYGDAYATGGNRTERGKRDGIDVGGWSTREQRSFSTAGSGLKPKDLLGMPWRVAFALQVDGWWLRADCIWAKPNPMPESVTDRPTKSHEYVFLLTKRARYFYDAEAVREPSEWTGKMPDGWDTGDGGHGSVHRNGREAGANNGAGGSGRNLRSVWTIPTFALPEAHFASFPPRLAEICIKAGTSEKGCCPACGAPWVRVVESKYVRHRQSINRTTEREGGRHVASHGEVLNKETRTTGWRPTCACPAADPVPCTVLDPFLGSGTTLLVADRLGRHGIGIELNPAYAAMAERRLASETPLFAEPEGRQEPVNVEMEL